MKYIIVKKVFGRYIYYYGKYWNWEGLIQNASPLCKEAIDSHLFNLRNKFPNDIFDFIPA